MQNLISLILKILQDVSLYIEHLYKIKIIHLHWTQRQLKNEHEILRNTNCSSIYIYVLTLTSKINGFRIELTPRTSIDSALFPKDLSPEEIHHRIAQLSRARALQLGSKQEPETLKPPVYPSPFANTNIYITKISIGSTQFSPYSVVDTGSDDRWLQCEGCTSCFPIKGGSFPVKE